MPLTTSKVKVPLGMASLDFWPIKEEPTNGHPKYDAPVNLGAAVKGYLTVSTNAASIFGDDIEQLTDEVFAGAQLDTETTMSDLQVNATLFGHTYSQENGEESKGTDRSMPGGISFIEPILRKDKTIIYRATCLRKCSAMPQSEKQEADTKKPGELAPKNNVVSYKILEDTTGVWRQRQDCETLEAAKQFINTVFGAATAGA